MNGEQKESRSQALGRAVRDLGGEGILAPSRIRTGKKTSTADKLERTEKETARLKARVEDLRRSFMDVHLLSTLTGFEPVLPS